MTRKSMLLVIGGLALVLGVANYDIWQKQQVVDNGQQVLLKLIPVDPRSLMQGDFMQLRYANLDFWGSLSGVRPHLERCTRFQDEDDKLVITNTCDEPVAVVFMQHGQRATAFSLSSKKELSTGISYSPSYVYTSCPLGYKSSVKVRRGTRGIIAASQYHCLEPNASIDRKGTIVLALDTDNVGSFRRMDDGSPLAENETRLQYKLIVTTDNFSIGAESFFFQEGQASFYTNARYGVLRVDADGESVLVGLADENHVMIIPPSQQ